MRFCSQARLKGTPHKRQVATAAANRLVRPQLTPKQQRRMTIDPNIPRLLAFDLDGTIWWPEMYMLNGGAPFRRDRRTGAVHDSSGTRIKLLGSTLDIFTQIATDPVWANTEVAYVSRTEYPEWAIPCLQQFEIPGTDGLTLLDIAAYKEIYPGSKLTHFAKIRKQSGIPYEDMLFLDNERWNITEVSKLGVVSLYTPDGVTEQVWQKGLRMFAESKQL